MRKYSRKRTERKRKENRSYLWKNKINQELPGTRLLEGGLSDGSRETTDSLCCRLNSCVWLPIDVLAGRLEAAPTKQIVKCQLSRAL